MLFRLNKLISILFCVLFFVIYSFCSEWNQPCQVDEDYLAAAISSAQDANPEQNTEQVFDEKHPLDNVDCSICYMPYFSKVDGDRFYAAIIPCVIPCGHQACEKCFDTITHSTPNNRSSVDRYSCHLCRKVFASNELYNVVEWFLTNDNVRMNRYTKVLHLDRALTIVALAAKEEYYRNCLNDLLNDYGKRRTIYENVELQSALGKFLVKTSIEEIINGSLSHSKNEMIKKYFPGLNVDLRYNNLDAKAKILLLQSKFGLTKAQLADKMFIASDYYVNEDNIEIVSNASKLTTQRMIKDFLPTFKRKYNEAIAVELLCQSMRLNLIDEYEDLFAVSFPFKHTSLKKFLLSAIIHGENRKFDDWASCANFNPIVDGAKILTIALQKGSKRMVDTMRKTELIVSNWDKIIELVHKEAIKTNNKIILDNFTLTV